MTAADHGEASKCMRWHGPTGAGGREREMNRSEVAKKKLNHRGENLGIRVTPLQRAHGPKMNNDLNLSLDLCFDVG